MPPSGDSRSDGGRVRSGAAAHGSGRAATGARRPLTLGELAHLGLAGSIGAGLLFSLGVGVGVGVADGVLCLLATCALLAASLPLLLHRRGELVDPIWLVVLTIAIGVTGKAFYLVKGPAERVEFLLLGKEPADMLFAALVLAAGMLVLSLGYLAGGVRWRIPGAASWASDSWDPRRFTAVVGFLTIGGLLSILVFVLRLDLSIDTLADLSSKRVVRLPGAEGPGLVYGYLRWGAMLIEVAFYLLLARWAAGREGVRSRAGMPVVAFALLAAAFPVFVSSREGLMLLVVRAILIWLCLRGQPKPRSVAAIAALALVVMGSMLALRRGQADWSSLRRHAGLSELLEVTVGGRHFLDLTKTAHVLDAVPGELDYRYGQTLVTWLVAPIPRSLWPGKPEIGPGKELGPVLFGTPVTTGVPPGIVGELYLNFGLAGVAIGLLAVGALLRSLYATFRPVLHNRAMVLVFAVLSSRLGLGLPANSVAATATRLLMETIPLIGALWLCRRRPLTSSSPGTSRSPDAGTRAAAP